MTELVVAMILMANARQPCDTIPECENNIRPYVEFVFDGHPSTTPDEAWSVIMCESSGKPTAKNPESTAGGVMQFLAGTFHGEAHYFGWPHPVADAESRFDPVLAINLAYLVTERDAVTRGASWSQWECKP